MTWDSALGSVIEVAISLAGFSGIVAAVGRRGAGQWTITDQVRLQILLTASGAVLLFAFLPFVLIDLMDPALVWRVVSGLMALWICAIVIYRYRQASREGIAKADGVPLFAGLSQFTNVLLLVANTVWFASPPLYLIALLWNTAIAFMAFVSLLMDSWRQAPGAAQEDGTR